MLAQLIAEGFSLAVQASLLEDINKLRTVRGLLLATRMNALHSLHVEATRRAGVIAQGQVAGALLEVATPALVSALPCLGAALAFSSGDQGASAAQAVEAVRRVGSAVDKVLG